MDLSGTFDLKAEAKTEITASHSERTKAIIEKDLCMEMIEAAYPFQTRKKEISTYKGIFILGVPCSVSNCPVLMSLHQSEFDC